MLILVRKAVVLCGMSQQDQVVEFARSTMVIWLDNNNGHLMKMLMVIYDVNGILQIQSFWMFE